MEEHVLPYKPDVVVLGFVRDDMRRSMWSFRHHSKLRLDNGLVVTNVPVPDSEAVLEQASFRFRSWDEIRWCQGWFEAEMVELGEVIIGHMIERTEEIGTEFVLVNLPHGEDLTMTYEQFHSTEEKFLIAYARGGSSGAWACGVIFSARHLWFAPET